MEGDLNLSRFVVSPGQDGGERELEVYTNKSRSAMIKQEQECNDRTRHLICSGGK